MEITIHNETDFIGMRKAGKLAAEVLDHLVPLVKPGTTTDSLNALAHDFIIKHNAIPAPLNYKGGGRVPFPKSICTSVNHVICHGIPSDKKLNDGDILNIDVTVILDGYYGDSSRMYYAGKPSIKAQRLCDITYECMMLGIEEVKPGAPLNSIGRAIQKHAEANGFSVVRDFCGHGIGKVFHAPPQVMHFYDPAANLILQEGMFFTIEPMINAGGWESKILNDDWTAVTKDRSLSAQFEHTIAVTKDGFEIFTLSPQGLLKPPYK